MTEITQICVITVNNRGYHAAPKQNRRSIPIGGDEGEGLNVG
jgi:hypothetical protein